MMKAIYFFAHYLNIKQLILCGIIFFIHIYSYIMFLDSEKYLNKQILTILQLPNALNELSIILLTSIIYLLIYSITMFFIEMYGKLAIKNAIMHISKKLLNADLTHIKKKDYEKNILSLVKHSDNITSIITSIFIEFPRKIIACTHFVIAINDLGTTMLYCIIINILILSISYILSCIRKKLITKITSDNIDLSILCSNIAESIQIYKVDNREDECLEKINIFVSNIWKNSSLDSLTIASGEILTNFSSQFMIGVLAFSCRPLVLNKSIGLEDVMYGIRSSTKFIEKMIGVVDYIGCIIRQYSSFEYFNNMTIIEEKCYIFEKNTEDNNIIIDKTIIKKTGITLIRGPNGAGKTTLLQKFLNISYLGAVCKKSMTLERYIQPVIYRKNIAYVDQNIIKTKDTVHEYIKAVSKTDCFQNMAEWLEIDTYISNFIKPLLNKEMRDLSGGQNKMVQILASICKVFFKKCPIIILDEPTNNLDIDKINILNQILTKLVENRIKIFMITHDDRILDRNYDIIEL